MLGSRMQRVAAIVRGEVSRAERHGRALSVLFVDVDDLRAVNEALGREAGDLVVELLPSLVGCFLRAGDVPVHAGGDELVVVLPETLARGAAVVAERVRAGVASAPPLLHGRPVPVRISVGVAEHRPGMTAEELVLEAEAAARAVKRARRPSSALTA